MPTSFVKSLFDTAAMPRKVYCTLDSTQWYGKSTPILLL